MPCYECGHCGYQTDTEDVLTEHMKKHVPSDLEEALGFIVTVAFFGGTIALALWSMIV